MFTIIIAEKRLFDAIEQNRLYFKPFLDRSPEDFAFCEWHPEGQTLYESVPDLVRLVGRHKLWRAVIVSEKKRDLFQNPYDYVDWKRVAEIEEKNRLVNPNDIPEEQSDIGDVISTDRFEEWKLECSEKNKAMLADKAEIYREALQFPLQRLATCLCFVPTDLYNKSAEKRQDTSDYVFEVIDTLNIERHLEEFTHQLHLSEEAIKNELRKECLDEMLPDDGYSRTKGSMGIVLPTEVYCFAERTTENGFFNPIKYWENHIDNDYSSFCNRNMYFDKMRFIVSDILPETHQDYRFDHIRFLYNLFLLALNDAPSGAMIPRKLYCIESENNEQPLRSLITSYIYKLDNTIEKVDGEIEKIKSQIPGELSDKEAKELFCAKMSIPVTLSDDFDGNELYAAKDNYGLASNCPTDETTKWLESYNKSQKAVDTLVKQPRRSLKKAVEKIDRESEVDYNKIRILNSFQMEDVRDYTEDSEDKMVSAKVSNIFDSERYHKKLEEENKKIRDILNGRMQRKTEILLGLICVGLLIVGFMPLIFNNRNDIGSVMTAVLLIVCAAGVLAGALLATLYFLRIPLKEAIASYNQAAKEILDEVHGAMKEYSDYLSLVCNVRRGYKVLNFSKNKIDIYDQSIRTRKKHKNDMEKMRAFVVENYGDFIDETDIGAKISVHPYDYEFGKANVEYDYTPPYLPEDAVTVEYLEKGNYATVPSCFVQKVKLRMEEIYDE